jgi:ADP-dependent NAD(P)H-hydrate dehydratase / NAD(P)H-hydrate epimerase
VSINELKFILEDLKEYLPQRRADANKGDFGHILIIGGEHGMSGAVMLSAEAALRAGAGKVTIATRAKHAHLVNIRCPEIMSQVVETPKELYELLKLSTVLILGPGLGMYDWGKTIWQAAISTDLPLVLDADGLNILAKSPVNMTNNKWIITPHPGEAARLLNSTIEQIQADRITAARQLAKKYQAMVVLKGAGTVICDIAGEILVCAGGNPGMASPGMGDVLSGIIAALLAQGLSYKYAATIGVGLHAAAADKLAKNGTIGLLASDLLPLFRELLHSKRR